jgi:predicted transcriptional regulator
MQQEARLIAEVFDDVVARLESEKDARKVGVSSTLQIDVSDGAIVRELSKAYASKPVSYSEDEYVVFDIIRRGHVSMYVTYRQKLKPSEYSEEYKRRQQIALDMLSEEQKQVLRLLSILTRYGLDADQGKALIEDLKAVYNIIPKKAEND